MRSKVKMTKCAKAYAQGAKAHSEKKPRIAPFGRTQLQLACWWFAGYSDKQLGVYRDEVEPI